MAIILDPVLEKQKNPSPQRITLGKRVIFFKWWRRRELNPRPKTVSNGIYILIPNFEFYWNVSSGMDTDQYSLKILTEKGSGIPFKLSHIVDALY